MSAVERALGAPVSPTLRPLLAVTVLSVVGQWMLTAYLPIYVVTRLDVATQTAGALLAGATATGLFVGPMGGRVADTVGRRPVLITSLILQACSAIALLCAPGSTAFALVAAVALAIGFTLRTTIQNTLAADVSHEADRDTTFALLRTAVNIAAAAGPAVGAALVLFGWPVLWFGSLLFSALAVVLVHRLAIAPHHRPKRPARPAAGSARFGPVAPSSRVGVGIAAAVAASVLAWAIYNAFEVLLPVVIVDVYGLAPSVWGLLFLLNPLGVALLQIRLVTWTAGLSRATRLTVATALMGAGFLLLIATRNIVAVAVVVVVFTAGEILWGPTAQALLTALAPPGRHGTAMGLLSFAATAGAVITAAGGLALIAHAGTTATWAIVAALGVASGFLFRYATAIADTAPIDTLAS